jgi:hypothetical protein
MAAMLVASATVAEAPAPVLASDAVRVVPLDAASLVATAAQAQLPSGFS